MKRNFLITLLLSFFCSLGLQAQSLNKAEVCFNRLHNAWAEMLIPVDQWNGDKVIFKTYDPNGANATGPDGEVYNTSELPKIISNGKEYYYLKGKPNGGNWNVYTYTYEVSSPLDTAVSKKLDPIPQDQWNTLSCSQKAAVCFSRLHNGWAEMLIPVDEWKGDKVIFKTYNLNGNNATGPNGEIYNISELPKIISNGKAYYYLKAKPNGGVANVETYTYEVSSPLDAAVSKTLEPIPQDQWNTLSCSKKAAVCFSRLHNGWAEMLIPVDEWKGDKVIFKTYNLNGTNATGPNGEVYNTSALPKITSNGKAYYYLKAKPNGGVANVETYTYEVSSPLDAAVSKTLDPIPQDQWNTLSCSKKDAVCFSRLHNGWAEMLIPVDEWKGDKVIFNTYNLNGTNATGSNGEVYNTAELPKIISKGKAYYYLKAKPNGGVANVETYTYEVSSLLDAAVSKTLDPIPQDQWNTLSCSKKAAVCFSRLHNGWTEMLIPVDEWKGDKVIFKTYNLNGTNATGPNGEVYNTSALPKIISNGKAYYYLKAKPNGGVANVETYTYEVSSLLDAAVSKTLDPIPQDQWNTLSCSKKAAVCFNRLHNAWAEMLIPVDEWKGDKVIFKTYNLNGTDATGPNGEVYNTSELPKIISNGKAYYYLKAKPNGGVANVETYTYEVSSLLDAAVSKTFAPIPKDQWNDFEKQKSCITKAGGICIDRDRTNYTIYIPVSEWKGTSVKIRFYNLNGLLIGSQDFATPATENYNGRNCYKIVTNLNLNEQVIIDASGPKNGAVHMLLDSVQSLCYEGACGGNNNWELTGNTATDPASNFIGTTDKQSLVFKTNNVESMRIDANGKIGIGTKNLSCTDCANYRLFVKDGIKTEKVKVEVASANGWADYVFSSDYKLQALEDVEKHIYEKGHLPNIPSADEVVKKGIDLAEMDARLLEKIEELTLYTIDLNKKNIELHQKNAELGGKVKDREEMIKVLLKKVEALEAEHKKSNNSNTPKNHE